MSRFKGTSGADTITPNLVSGGVIARPANAQPGLADDRIDAGGGDDVVAGGGGADSLRLGAGNDRAFWRVGDGDDTVDGGAGLDTLRALGSATAANVFRFALDPANDIALRLDADSSRQTLRGIERIELVGGAAADRFDASLLTLASVGLDVSGGGGADTILLGAGDDTVTWNAGDGSDTIEGNAGVDSFVFNGTAAADNISIGPTSGARAIVTVGAARIETRGLEALRLSLGDGADTLGIGTLAGTGIQRVSIALGDDGAADLVRLFGNDVQDLVVVEGSGGTVDVSGLSAAFHLEGFDTSDLLELRLFSGNDVLDAAALDGVRLQVEGGKGNDVIALGSGDDIGVWLSGDGNDVIDGRGGLDTLLFAGNESAERITIQDDVGGGVRVLRDISTVVLRLDNMERIDVQGFGGFDTLDGSGMTDAGVGLSLDGGDAADSLTGGAGADLLEAGAGNDALRGGGGGDRFLFGGSTANGAFELDVIFDYSKAAGDVIDLTALGAPPSSFFLDGLGITIVLAGGDGDAVAIRDVFSVDDLVFAI